MRHCERCGYVIQSGTLCDVCASPRPMQITNWDALCGYRRVLVPHIVEEEPVLMGQLRPKTNHCLDCGKPIENRSKWCNKHANLHSAAKRWEKIWGKR